MKKSIDINQISPADLKALSEIKKRKEDVWGNICKQTCIDVNSPKTVVMPKRHWGWSAGIAAALAAVLALGVFVFVQSPKIDTVEKCSHSFAATNDRSVGMLEDASAVCLAQGTAFGYEFTEDERIVVMKGLASFDVKRDENRPFIVRLQDRGAEITVLGTSFVVENVDGRDKCGVRVKSGNVRLTTPLETVDLKYGERAIVSGTAIEKRAIRETANGDWAADKLDLRGATLGEVVDELMSLYPEIKRVKDSENLVEEMRDILVTSKFEKETMDKVLKELSLHYGIKIEFDGESLILSR